MTLSRSIILALFSWWYFMIALAHASQFPYRRVVVGGLLWVELVHRHRLSGPLDGRRNAAGEHLGEVELALNSARSAFSQSMIRWASA